jgi:hypothetical protein
MSPRGSPCDRRLIRTRLSRVHWLSQHSNLQAVALTLRPISKPGVSSMSLTGGSPTLHVPHNLLCHTLVNSLIGILQGLQKFPEVFHDRLRQYYLCSARHRYLEKLYRLVAKPDNNSIKVFQVFLYTCFECCMFVEALESSETSTKILLKLCKNAFGICHLLYDLYQVVRYNGGSLGYCSYSDKKGDCSQYGLSYKTCFSNIR